MGRTQHTNPRQNPPEPDQPTKKERSSGRVRTWIRECRWISESAEQMAAEKREKLKREKEARRHEMYPSSEEVQPEPEGR
jgi:hypothetical protein